VQARETLRETIILKNFERIFKTYLGRNKKALQKIWIKMNRQEKYNNTEKGKESLKKAQKKYDSENLEKRREQKRNYMRRKREQDPNYCKWK
jgi:hypothetical protein|tara:strand:+ start:32 stop:307 length:276 start_codon:yes stop_codon:yes gene_type:complete